MSFQIKEVNSAKDLRAFIKFPDILYKGCPQYVPALHSDQRKTLTGYPSLSFCPMKLWIVMDGRNVVGRIGAVINPRYNSLYGTKRARFGWFDTINDPEVASLLIGSAEKWAAANGMEEIHGPLFFNTLGKQGLLVEGFENIPPFNCIYNFPYYQGLIENLGFSKECDWVQYRIKVGYMPDKTRRLASIIKEKYHLHSVSLSRIKKDPESVRAFFKTYSDSFASSVYNFIPFTAEEIENEAKSVLPFISDKLCSVIADENDRLVGFGILFPSISQALQKARGHLLPFGWIHLLRAMHEYSTVDLMLNGVVPEWQNKGVSALYFSEIADKTAELGLEWAICNPQIENNSAVNIWSSYDHELFMRRRCYIKTIR